MTRVARKRSSTDIYHVIIRGVDKMRIFREDSDRNFFVSYMRRKLDDVEGSLYAWCLMDNHVHLLIRMDFLELSDFMQGINTTYALYFNKKYDRCGHLLQDRFKSEAVESDAYFLTVVRYIHQNPVKAFMTPDCHYRWSSYGEYLKGPMFTDTAFVLKMFGGLPEFLSFHRNVCFEDRCVDILLALSDEEAVAYAGRVLGEGKLESLARCDDRAERDACLRTLKNCMLPLKQIARISGLSYSTVQRA